VTSLRLPTFAEIEAAQSRLADISGTPLVEVSKNVLAKLENVSPIGAFKVRGAGNLIRSLPEAASRGGIWTASAGNMALAVAWHAARLGIPALAIVPDSAPDAKTEAVRALGARVVAVSFDEWWATMEAGQHPEAGEGIFVHPFADTDVIAGNATIGLELAGAIPNLTAVTVPFGGGGLSLGIASALRVVMPDVRVYPIEVATAAPLRAAWRAGGPAETSYTRTFVDGIGARSVTDDIWGFARELLMEPIVVELDEIETAISELARTTHTIAEGAGAAALAGALRLTPVDGVVAAVISGGNIDLSIVGRLLTSAV
jgi:threonine dehydratase